MREAGRIVCEILDALEKAVAPGRHHLGAGRRSPRSSSREKGAKPAFKGYHGFPACCAPP